MKRAWEIMFIHRCKILPTLRSRCKNPSWWVDYRMTDKYLLIINLDYPLTCQFTKLSKKWFWYIITVLKNIQKVKRTVDSLSVLSWKLSVFEVLKQPELTVLWIWIFFQRTRIDSSLILKYLKNQNSWLFLNSENHPTLVRPLHTLLPPHDRTKFMFMEICLVLMCRVMPEAASINQWMDFF
jgi:hypothetical protein